MPEEPPAATAVYAAVLPPPGWRAADGAAAAAAGRWVDAANSQVKAVFAGLHVPQEDCETMLPAVLWVLRWQLLLCGVWLWLLVSHGPSAVAAAVADPAAVAAP